MIRITPQEMYTVEKKLSPEDQKMVFKIGNKGEWFCFPLGYKREKIIKKDRIETTKSTLFLFLL